MSGVTAGAASPSDSWDMGADGCCGLVAGAQHGCITLAQAISCGLSGEGVRRRVRARRWRRVLPATYALQGAPESWEQRLAAATLWAGEGAAVSGASAAALWGFPDFGRGSVEVSHEGTRRSRKGVTVRRVCLPESDVTRVRGIPVTTPARTLSDIAGATTTRAFDAALHHCLNERVVALEELEELLDTRSGTGFVGAARLRDALAAYGSGRAAGSPLEARLARRLSKTDLPAPVR